MKYLGVDYGKKKVGIALSDDSESFAFPLAVLDNSEKLLSEIEIICKKNKVEEIVMGESKDFLQRENEIMKDIVEFIKDLKKNLNLPVHLHPEFMTSIEAERLQGKNEMHDASAAALILKSYLDSKNSHGK